MPEIINGTPSAADIETYIVTDEAATALNTTHRGLASGNPHSVTPTELGLVIGTNVQAFSAALDDLTNAGVVTGNSYFLVGTGAGTLAWETGSTVRTSLGLGVLNSPTFAGTIFKKAGNVIMSCNTYKTGVSGTRWYLRHSNSDVLETLVTTIDGQELGMILFHGVDTGSNFDTGALIQAVQNGAAGDKIPTDILFTTSTGSASNWNHLVLSTTSNVGIGIDSFGTNMTKGIAQATGIAPTTSPADCFQMYSADIAPGHAACHIRNENGTIIKLYQQAHQADSTTQDIAGGDTVDETKLESDLAGIVSDINSMLVVLENNGLLATS